ncbi:TIR domain-containing adapter molecule 1, partial [Acanthisitta chloris]
MAQSTELQPSFEDVFKILSQVSQDKLLSLKLKLKHSVRGPSTKLLQAMVMLTLGQETQARICLDALRDTQAAHYVLQTKLGAAAVWEGREDLQPPQLDAGTVELLAQVYEVLAQEKLCSAEARDKACQAASKACHASKDTPWGTLNNILPEEQDKHSSATSVGTEDRFHTLKSDVDTGSFHTNSPNHVVSSPEQIRGNSCLSGSHTFFSEESSSLTSRLEISASPTADFHTQPSSAGQPDRDRQSPQEMSWASSPSSHPGQDTGAQVPQAEKAVQISSCHPALPDPEVSLPSEGAVSQPAPRRDAPTTVPAEPRAPREHTDKEQQEKHFSTGLPDPRATVDTGPAHMSREDSYIPADIPSNSTSPSIPTHPLPPPRQEPPSNIHPPPLHSSPSPCWPPPLPAVDPAPTSEPDGAKFFTFVVLHASEDVTVAKRVKNLLENMGVANGATLCEDFSIAGRSHMTCFQDAMENSAFVILLLTNNFTGNLCLFQTDTALMQSLQDPAKRYSVIPFLPKENALEQSQIPLVLRVLVTLHESSPLFHRTVHNTFNSKNIRKKKAMWDEVQRRKHQLYWEQHQAQQNLAGLSLGSSPQVPPAA